MSRKPTGKMMAAIVCNLPDAAFGIDREGRILIFNQAAGRLFNIDPIEVEGRKIWDVLDIDDLTRTIAIMVKDQNAAPLEQIFPMKQNRVFQAKIIPVRDNDGRVVGAVAILQDLTEIHKMEVTVNEFVTMVSHELKTPLTSIKGFVETLLEGALNNTEVTRRFLQVINEETNRMVRLVISLLDLTHAMRGDSEMKKIRPVDTSQFIMEAVKLFEPVADEKGIKITAVVPDNLPTILVNPDKLRQVVINLVDNAIKYTGIKGAGGTVEVRAGVVNNFLKVDVIDSGIGIPPGEKDKIFEKFYRVTDGPASQLGGTGLGLSITREIIKDHGGEVTVKSRLGEGSEFSFTIPIPEKQE